MQEKLWNFDAPLSDREVLEAFIGTTFMTRREVANKLRRAKSPTLVSRMNNLAAKGFLHVEYFTLPNRVDMWVYSLTDDGAAEIGFYSAVQAGVVVPSAEGGL